MAQIDNTVLLQRVHTQLERLEHFETGEKGGSGEPPRGGNAEARIAKLEADVNHIQSDTKEIKVDIREIKKDAREDFRVLFGAIIVCALGLAGLIAKGFKWF